MGTDGQVVEFRDCTCPGTPHDKDAVTLPGSLPFVAGHRAMRAVQDLMVAAAGTGITDADALTTYIGARLFEAVGPIYLEQVTGWNVVDDDGPVPLDIASLPFDEQYLIAEAANDLYTPAVMRPLTLRLSASLSATRTATTSRTRASGRSRRKPASRSSRGTSAAGKASGT